MTRSQFIAPPQQVPVQGGRVDTRIFRKIAGEFPERLVELTLGAGQVFPCRMVSRDCGVNQRLQEEPFRPRRTQPHRLPHLVGLEVLAAIVERHACAQTVLHSCMIEVVANWLDRLRGKPAAAPGPLRGAPAVPRLKNYAALSGYAYEYVFDGYRDLAACREYVFRLSGDRKNWLTLPVRLNTFAVAAWERNAGRALRDNEKYAAAKLALFAAFDDRPQPDAMREPVEIDATVLQQLLAQAGLE